MYESKKSVGAIAFRPEAAIETSVTLPFETRVILGAIAFRPEAAIETRQAAHEEFVDERWRNCVSAGSGH